VISRLKASYVRATADVCRTCSSAQEPSAQPTGHSVAGTISNVLVRALRAFVLRTLGSEDFYARTVEDLLEHGVLARDMRVLVACGGNLDKDVLSTCGFTDVTISNLDPRLDSAQFLPYAWSHQDVEHLTFDDNAFDFAIVHNGLHHCYSPHKALLELYRVARKGVLVFEPCDTALVRLSMRLSFGQRYEVASVSHNGLRAGGVGNSQVPNFIYRWTEREIKKTVLSYAPYGKHRFWFMYAMRVPWNRLLGLKNPVFLVAVIAGMPMLKLLFRLFPKQANGLAFAIEKPAIPGDLHAWLRWDEEASRVVVRDEWMQHRYLVSD
jgi:SAM-dependent methyltransferase